MNAILRRLTQPKVLYVLSFVWGLAEATVFFIVPDVLLSAIGCRSIRTGLKATIAALLGALAGGYLMFYAGQQSPDPARQFLVRVPAIHPPQVERVRSQLAAHGAVAVLIGPTIGVPYKIYAVESGARRDSLLVFLLISIPARGVRFVLSVMVAGGIATGLAPWTRRRPKIEFTVLILFWTAFYTFYFIHFGW